MTTGGETVCRAIGMRGRDVLSVGAPTSPPPRGWSWRRLGDLARLESGHTPSRRRPEWWGGDVPWLALPDIRRLDGKVANETSEYTNALGIANSSARVLPSGTVVLSRTASVGYVTVLGRPMATSQDFVNWVCGPELDPRFLSYLFQHAREYIRSLASGAIHKTVYVPTVEAFWTCVPAAIEQRRIADLLDQQMSVLERARAAAEARLEAATALKEARVRLIFGGEGARRWERRELSEIIQGTGQYGLSVKTNSEPIGLPVLRMGNISPGQIRWTDLKYVDLPESEADKYRLSEGDLLFNRTNSAELVGKTAVFRGKQEALFASYLIRFRVHGAEPSSGRTWLAQSGR